MRRKNGQSICLSDKQTQIQEVSNSVTDDEKKMFEREDYFPITTAQHLNEEAQFFFYIF